jgi:hypothetical protein
MFRQLSSILIAVSLLTATAAGAGAGPFAPREHPSSEGSPVDAVIVTSAEMAAAFQPLADWHLGRGFRTVVRDLDWIAANYPPGRDRGENIRFFLQDARELWGLQVVILGGDTDVVPARFVTNYAGGGPPELVPSDLYYACLDGNWNGDGDEFWCEGEIFGVPGDEADLMPDLLVGRLPVSDPGAATDLLNKLMAYRETRRADFQDRILFLAEVLFPSTWSPGDDFADIVVDGGNYAQGLVEQAIGPDMSHVELFQSWESPYWDTGVVNPQALSVQSALDSMDTGGWAFVDQNGHGYRYNMSVGDGSVGVSQALALRNDMPFHISLMNCTSTAFDFDCLGENFLRNPEGGAVAVFGTTRSSYPIHSWRYADLYYKSMLRDGVTMPGEAIQNLREIMAPVDDGDGYSRWTYLIMTFLGDPILDLWAGPARQLSISAPASAPTGPQLLAFHVEIEGEPAAEISLTLSKAGEVWATGKTDAAGNLTLAVEPVTAGELTLGAWGVNCFMESLTIPVSSDGEALPRLVEWRLEDDPALDPRNDADGLFEAGESARLEVLIRNEGALATGPLSLDLESLSDSLTVLGDQADLSSLDPGAELWVTSGLGLLAAPGTPDGLRQTLALHLTVGRALPRSDTLSVAPLAPDHRLAEWTFMDVGNGDGVWDESESWRAVPRWVNLGGGSGGPLSLELISLHADLVVVEGLVSAPSLELLAGGGPDPGFLIQRVDPAQNYPAQLILTDAFGRSSQVDLGFAAPSAPLDLVPDASAGAGRLDLGWQQGNEPDLAGYHVYLSQSGPENLQRATLLPLPHTGISLSGLAENSLTWLAVTAVDSSGMESAFSDTLLTSTNPSQLAGFPRETLGTSSCPVAVGNVAGDAGLELVVAADLLYVWHHDGGEPLDGDLETETLGVFSVEVHDVAGAVTLLPLLADGYRQIVVAARDGEGLGVRGFHVLDHEGQLLPGWPQATLDWIWTNPIGADLDGDGDLEIAGLDRSGNLYAFHHDGLELVDGDADPGTNGILARGLGSYADGSPAAADLDGDGDAELVVLGGAGQKWLHAFRADGSELAGWPVNLDPGGLYGGLNEGCPLVIANLDGDPGGELEIIVQSEMDSLFVFKADGSRYPGFPLYMVTNNSGVAPGPVPVDLDEDGDLELFIVETVGGSISRLNLIHHDGGDLPGWPIEHPANAQCSPVVGDLDGDGDFEFILGSEQGIVFGYSEDGTVQPGFPIDVGGEVRGTPALADLDQDGDIELLASTWNHRVLVWDFDGPFSEQTAPWPTLSGNYYRNGLAGDWDNVPVTVSEVSLTVDGEDILVAWRRDDPEHGSWGLERRQRLQGEQLWSVPQVLAADLHPGAGGWLRWRDADLSPDIEYEYRALIELDGEIFRVPLGSLGLGEGAPAFADRLHGAHPNPFNPTTTLVFELAAEGPARLEIYSVKGRRLRSLLDGRLAAGRHELQWDGRDDAGRHLPSGLYLLRYSRPGRVLGGRVMLLK